MKIGVGVVVLMNWDMFSIRTMNGLQGTLEWDGK